MKSEFIGTCVSNPFGSVDKLCNIIDNAREVSKRTFLKHVDVDEDVLVQMKRFPNDFRFYKNNGIYFFTWSAIEHFFITKPQDVN